MSGEGSGLGGDDSVSIAPCSISPEEFGEFLEALLTGAQTTAEVAPRSAADAPPAALNETPPLLSLADRTSMETTKRHLEFPATPAKHARLQSVDNLCESLQYHEKHVRTKYSRVVSFPKTSFPEQDRGDSVG